MFDALRQLAGKLYEKHQLDNASLKSEREIFQSLYRKVQELKNTFTRVKPTQVFSKAYQIINEAEHKLALLSYNYLASPQGLPLKTLANKVDYLSEMLSSFQTILESACAHVAERNPSLSSPLNSSLLHEEERDTNCCKFFWSLVFVSPEKQLRNDILEVIKAFNTALYSNQLEKQAFEFRA